MHLSFKKSCHLAAFPFCLMEDDLIKDYGLRGFPGGTSGKESVCQCRSCKRRGFDPWAGGFSGGRHCNPLQYSCLENAMGRGVRQATVHGVAKSWTQLKWLSTQHVGSMRAGIRWVPQPSGAWQCRLSTNTDGWMGQGTYCERLWASYFSSLGPASFLWKMRGFDFIMFLSCYKLPKVQWKFLVWEALELDKRKW